MKARGPIHAMLPNCDSPTEADARETELDRRLDAYRAEVRAEVLAEAVAEAEQTARGFSTGTDWGSAAVGALQGLVYRLRQLAGQPPSATGASREAAVRADALKLFLFHLEQSSGHDVAAKLLEDAPELTNLMQRPEGGAR